MASVQAAKPVITSLDRLGLTLGLALLFHALLILGITFAEEDRPRTRSNSMEIILVQKKSPEPEEAKIFAQFSNEGGGNVDEPAIPSAPMPAPFPDVKPEITMPQSAKEKPPPLPGSASTETIAEEPSSVKKELVATLTVEDNESSTPIVERIKTTKSASTPEKKKIKETIEKPVTPTATELVTNSFKIASLSAEIDRKMKAKAERPRQKFISARTKDHRDVLYINAWRLKVERIGNINYPEQARKQGLSGSLILNVALRPDGTINEITIRKSSGEKMLDDAAIRIVELAAPFSPFPPHIKDEYDILNITRTWQFLNNKSFK